MQLFIPEVAAQLEVFGTVMQYIYIVLLLLF